MRRDSRGRLRRQGQERGLRPLYPRLPGFFESRLLRAAMARSDWAMLDRLAAAARASGEPTAARAVGAAIARLLRAAEPAPVRSAVLWLDWEMEKSRRPAGNVA
jgi:hypothetical protein